MRSAKYLVIGLAALAVTACAGTDLQEARRMSTTGSGYTQDLASGYLELSQMEYTEGDYTDSDLFAQKSMASGRGQSVAPEAVGNWDLPSDKVGELTQARARLVAAQEKGAVSVAPADAARAQLMYDCWIQEQAENFQPDDIAACKDSFMAAMDRIDAAMAPKPMAATPPVPGSYLVFFDWDSSALTPEALNIIQTAVNNAAKEPGKSITAIGHTDTSGSAEYNLGLSVRRADTVKAQMVAEGVSGSRITTKGVGQTQPLVPTGDGVREPQNRRVEIVFQ